METTTLQQKRRRKALLILPLVITCFTTLLFHVLGGGQAEASAYTSPQTGLNKKLPDARIKSDQPLSKMAYYNQAAADSAKQDQLRQTDPYAGFSADGSGDSAKGVGSSFLFHQRNVAEESSPQASAQKINERLSALQQIVNKPEKPQADKPAETQVRPAVTANPTAGEDPELKQMNGLLEKILDIQHPERVKEQIAQAAPVIADTEPFRAVPAVVDGTQKIVQGTVIRLKLLDSVRFGGQFFPKGALIFGSGDLYNQRYKVNIRLVRLGLNIIPVNLTIFDTADGMEGISVPEAITGDALKEGAVNGLQNADLMSFDPSVTAQLTTAGINTAKGLFSKKVKRVKGKIKEGHQVLIRDNKAIKAPVR